MEVSGLGLPSSIPGSKWLWMSVPTNEKTGAVLPVLGVRLKNENMLSPHSIMRHESRQTTAFF
jgi:hypothetical protein